MSSGQNVILRDQSSTTEVCSIGKFNKQSYLQNNLLKMVLFNSSIYIYLERESSFFSFLATSDSLIWFRRFVYSFHKPGVNMPWFYFGPVDFSLKQFIFIFTQNYRKQTLPGPKRGQRVHISGAVSSWPEISNEYTIGQCCGRIYRFDL